MLNDINVYQKLKEIFTVHNIKNDRNLQYWIMMCIFLLLWCIITMLCLIFGNSTPLSNISMLLSSVLLFVFILCSYYNLNKVHIYQTL